MPACSGRSASQLGPSLHMHVKEAAHEAARETACMPRYADGDAVGFWPQRRRAHLEAKLQQLTLNLAEEAGPRRSKRSRGEIIDKVRGIHALWEGSTGVRQLFPFH